MMEEGLISQSHFMDSERESATRMEGEEEEELYDFLPFQTEFLIPLRDRAFSWDVKFEDEIHGDNEGPAISVISEQQDSHRLVIKAKASTANKRQTENKEQDSSATATADQSNKKSKNGAVNKKKETLGITSPTLVAGKANLKPTPTASSSNSNAGSSSGSKAVPAKSTATKANGTGAKTAAAARKLANMGVTASPSTDNLETQTLRNTINNAKSTVGETDYSQLFVKSEFPDSFGFGNEFDPTAPDRHGVSFDDGLNMHFKAEEDFPGLHEEAFGDDFRPPRKLSWNIDLNAIEAAMNSEGGFGSGSGSYLYDGPGGDSVGSGSFPSLLRASEAGTAYPDTSGMHGAGTSGGSTTMSAQAVNKSSGSAPMGITTTASRYLSSLSSGGMGGSDGSGGPSGQGATPASMLPSNTTKAAERDHLASLMSGVGQSHAHSHGPSGLSLSGSYGATSTSHSGGMGSGTLLGGDATLSSSGAVGGLTLGGLTVPNDGEYRVGAYTKLERHLKIEAFREKKRTRIWRKQIKYDCRKRLADTRPRVKGRFVSRKGEKGGPTEGGDDTEAGGADGVDGGPDGAPQRLQHPPQATHATGVQGPGGNHGNVMHPPPGNMHHHPPHMSGHGGHGAMSHMPTGMLKQPGGYVGPNSAADAHHHPGGVGSSIHGIKTEMKYSGSAHPMPAHLQGHGHHNNHSLPSIPQSIYTPGAVGTALPSGHHGGSAGRPLGHMNNMQSHQPHYAPGPAHNLLSQSQQQKLHPHAQGGPLHHPQTHPTPPNLSGHAPSSVPTGLLLSGPSSALLHNASSSAGGVHGVTTLPSVSTAPASSTPMVMPPTPGAGLSIAAARSALPAAPASLAPPVTAPQPVAPMASAASPAPAAQPAVSVPVPPKPQ